MSHLLVALKETKEWLSSLAIPHCLLLLPRSRRPDAREGCLCAEGPGDPTEAREAKEWKVLPVGGHEGERGRSPQEGEEKKQPER